MKNKEMINQSNRDLISASQELFELRRDINGFLNQVRSIKDAQNISCKELSERFGFGKNVIQSWLSGEKKPSQEMQKKVCQFLNIPYDTLSLTPNKQGEYPCGIRICKHCKSEFPVFKKTNYLRRTCCSKFSDPV
ncbi:helix-turn-helix domain-containing protein [Acinetobacter sp. BSP-28]|uniref:helix-turn-helix domain-containing protein n=1 Tax=Acinetobacter sp. BSP-28 TaxID=3344661 RepID=UPI00376FC000